MSTGIYIRTKPAWNKGQNIQTNTGRTHFKSGMKPWNTGKAWPEETRKLMSLARIGKVPWNKGAKGTQIAWNKGLKMPQISGEKHPMFGTHPVAWNKGKKTPETSGERNGMWKGGITPINQKLRASIEYKLWQDSVKNRDSNCCQKCGESRVSKIMAHHILNFSSHPELRLAIDNGVTFCRPCHKEFHVNFGFKNNNREQLEEFLGRKI